VSAEASVEEEGVGVRVEAEVRVVVEGVARDMARIAGIEMDMSGEFGRDSWESKASSLQDGLCTAARHRLLISSEN
jgi:hypothetical protein